MMSINFTNPKSTFKIKENLMAHDLLMLDFYNLFSIDQQNEAEKKSKRNNWEWRREGRGGEGSRLAPAHPLKIMVTKKGVSHDPYLYKTTIGLTSDTKIHQRKKG